MNLPEQTLASTPRSQKVLIADDDPPTRVLLRAAIQQWGYVAVEAKDGEEAWEILQKEDSPRLLIIDWLMPKLDGIGLCLRIKQELIYHPYPYIILLTQVSGTSNIIKGLEAGADEFLSKPFNMAELRSRLAVGERIIKYERTIAARNKQLQGCILEVETLAALLFEISKNMTELLESSNLLEKNDNSKMHIAKIKQLHTNLVKVSSFIKTFEQELKKEAD